MSARKERFTSLEKVLLGVIVFGVLALLGNTLTSTPAELKSEALMMIGGGSTVFLATIALATSLVFN